MLSVGRNFVLRHAFLDKQKYCFIPLQHQRFFSDFTGGANLLEESKEEERPKIVLDAHAPTGFDVSNMIQNVQSNAESDGTVHMTCSILAFDRACFQWQNIDSFTDVSYESLAPILLYKPKLKYLFIGCNHVIPEFASIKSRSKQEAGIVCEQLSIHNAMGTFNILNGEDRSVAAALVLEAEVDNNNDEEE